jgi:hypothetical protein
MIVDFEKIKFELDEEVWVICGPNSIMKTSIRAFQGIIFNSSKKSGNVIGIAKEAKLSNWILEDYFPEVGDGSAVPFKYLTKDEDKAREWMKSYPVSMRSPEEWLIAIGDRDKQEDEIGYIEDGCELGSCCSNISDIRDCLIRCKEKGGLIGWEREDLQWKIDNSGHDIPEDHRFLDKIFSQLKIEWKA